MKGSLVDQGKESLLIPQQTQVFFSIMNRSGFGWNDWLIDSDFQLINWGIKWRYWSHHWLIAVLIDRKFKVLFLHRVKVRCFFKSLQILRPYLSVIHLSSRRWIFFHVATRLSAVDYLGKLHKPCTFSLEIWLKNIVHHQNIFRSLINLYYN